MSSVKVQSFSYSQIIYQLNLKDADPKSFKITRNLGLVKVEIDTVEHMDLRYIETIAEVAAEIFKKFIPFFPGKETVEDSLKHDKHVFVFLEENGELLGTTIEKATLVAEGIGRKNFFEGHLEDSLKYLHAAADNCSNNNTQYILRDYYSIIKKTVDGLTFISNEQHGKEPISNLREAFSMSTKYKEVEAVIKKRINDSINRRKDVARVFFEYYMFKQAADLFRIVCELSEIISLRFDDYKQLEKVSINMQTAYNEKNISALADIFNSISNAEYSGKVLKIISTIKPSAQKGNEYFKEGSDLFSKAFEDEKKDKVEATKNFQLAQNHFADAVEQWEENLRYKNFLQACKLKIDGNSRFNEAIELQHGGNINKSMLKYVDARKKYQEALDKLSEALKISGFEKFNFCIEVVQRQLEKIKELIDNIEKDSLVDDLDI